MPKELPLKAKTEGRILYCEYYKGKKTLPAGQLVSVMACKGEIVV